MSDVIIRSQSIKMVPLDEIKLNADNMNQHPPEQIDRLAKIIQESGFRTPGTISNRSGILIAGEGRYWAAKKLGMKKMPCIYQDFDSDESEFSHGIADNALQSWSVLNLSKINQKIGDMGPFDLSLLGMQNFDVMPEYEEKKEKQSDSSQSKVVQCPNCGEQFTGSDHTI
jgi:hypothetical protein